MLFQSTLIAAAAVLFAGATGEPVPAEAAVAPQPFIATTPYYACNCPNNCGYSAGTGCRFYSGPSSTSQVISGHCYGSPLTCVA